MQTHTCRLIIFFLVLGQEDQGTPIKEAPLEKAVLRPIKAAKTGETAPATMGKPNEVPAARTKGRGKAHEVPLEDGQRTKPGAVKAKTYDLSRVDFSGPGKPSEAVEEGANALKEHEQKKRPAKQDAEGKDGKPEDKGAEAKDGKPKQKDAAVAKEKAPASGKTGAEGRDGGVEPKKGDVAARKVPDLGKTGAKEEGRKDTDVAKRKGPGLVGAEAKDGKPEQKGADATRREAKPSQPKSAEDLSDKTKTRSPERKGLEEAAGAQPQKAVEEKGEAPKPERAAVKDAIAKPLESDSKKETPREKVKAPDKQKGTS